MRLRMGVGGNARPIGFIGRPVDKARVMLWDEDRPFGAWQLAGLPFAPPGRIERDLTARFSVDIGARVSRVCQHMINCGVARVDPPDRCTIMGLHRKGQALAAQPKPDPTHRTEFGKAREDGADCRGHRRIGVKADLAVLFAPDEAHRETATQFAPRRFVADAAEQASPQDVQLGLTHRAFQAEHQSVVEHCRVVDPIGVADQSVGQAAEIEQAVPIGVIAGQTRDLQAEHDTDMPQRDLRGEPGKATAFDNA